MLLVFLFVLKEHVVGTENKTTANASSAVVVILLVLGESQLSAEDEAAVNTGTVVR